MNEHARGGSSQAAVVKSAVRTIEILEYFDEVRHPLNVVSVAVGLGYPQSSTAALLRSLTAMGYLQYDAGDRTYVPTDRVPFLGSWVNPALFEDGALPRLLRAIEKRTGQLVVVAARNQDAAQYVHVLNGPQAVPHHIRIGQKRPLATSGVGQVLLSSMGEKEIKRLYHRINAYAASPEDKTDVTDLLARLASIRERGYAFSRNRVMAGFGMIAFPIPPSYSSRPLAIGVGGFCDILDKRERDLVQTVQEEMTLHLRTDEAVPARNRRTVQIPAFATLASQRPSKTEQRVA